MSTILRVDGLLGKMTGTAYGEQVTVPRGGVKPLGATAHGLPACSRSLAIGRAFYG